MLREKGDLPGPKRILVVDDEPFVRTVVQRILQRERHLVETAQSGPEALQKTTAHKFDLVITDFNMPGMKGDELALVLKQQNSSLPVVLLTATPPVDKPPAVDCLIEKRVTPQDLRSLLVPFLGDPHPSTLKSKESSRSQPSSPMVSLASAS